MKDPDARRNDERRVDEPHRPENTQHASAPPGARTPAHFVDPYDMRSEPQPEEPGYGHGV